MRNRFFRFVAHIGKAKRLSLELPVTAINHQMMSFAQVAHQFRNIDSAVIFHTGERHGTIALSREKFEPALLHPGMDERVRARMPRVAIR